MRNSVGGRYGQPPATASYDGAFIQASRNMHPTDDVTPDMRSNGPPADPRVDLPAGPAAVWIPL